MHFVPEREEITLINLKDVMPGDRARMRNADMRAAGHKPLHRDQTGFDDDIVRG